MLCTVSFCCRYITSFGHFTIQSYFNSSFLFTIYAKSIVLITLCQYFVQMDQDPYEVPDHFRNWVATDIPIPFSCSLTTSLCFLSFLLLSSYISESASPKTCKYLVNKELLLCVSCLLYCFPHIPLNQPALKLTGSC